jgi:uncharacterized protein YciI
MSYFVVLNAQGPAWVEGRPMREQDEWTAHARFINDLVAAGFIVMGGPLTGGPTHRAMLIVSSKAESDVRIRLADDPWMCSGVLEVERIEPWEILASSDRIDAVLAEVAPR